jgi:hypothetical protein
VSSNAKNIFTNIQVTGRIKKNPQLRVAGYCLNTHAGCCWMRLNKAPGGQQLYFVYRLNLV